MSRAGSALLAGELRVASESGAWTRLADISTNAVMSRWFVGETCTRAELKLTRLGSRRRMATRLAEAEAAGAGVVGVSLDESWK